MKSFSGRFQFVLLIASLFASSLSAQNIFTQAINNLWSDAGNWSLAHVPSTGESVSIPAGDSCVVDITTDVMGFINIDGVLYTNNNATAHLSIKDSIYVNGTLRNDGRVEQILQGKVFRINAGGTYVHNPFANEFVDESIFYYGAESFATTSTLVIMKWNDLTVPLGDISRVQGNFGNVILSVPTGATRWDQMGNFSQHRIRGSFTATDGYILMDGGMGSSSQLTMQDVLITGNANLVVRIGITIPYVFTTNNFTDNSTSIYPTALWDTCFATEIWNANGNVNISHNFVGMRGTYNETGGNLKITVTGDFVISGTPTVDLVYQADGFLTLNVTGQTRITGAPSRVRFLDGNNGNVVFNTGDLIISGGSSNIFMGGNPLVPKAKGIITMTVANDFLINGASSTIVNASDTNFNKVRVVVGRDFTMSNSGGQLTVANTFGAVTFKVTRDIAITGGQFIGQLDSANLAVDSLITGGNFTFDSPTATDFFRVNYGQGNTFFNTTANFNVLNSGTTGGQGVCGNYQGIGVVNFSVGGVFLLNGGMFNGIYNGKALMVSGNCNFTVNGMFSMNGGIFRGINNLVIGNSSLINFNVNSIDYKGGNFGGYYTTNITNGTATFNILNDCKISFAAVADTFSFVSIPVLVPDFSLMKLNLTVGGNLSISNADGVFVSSYAINTETINITGNVSISSGTNGFNVKPASFSTSHKVNMTVGGDILLSGGTTFLSGQGDSLFATVNGNLSLSGGTLTIKGRSGVANVNVKGGYNQTGGTLYLHNNVSSFTIDPITLTINSDDDANGDFSHTAGTINFDNNISGSPVGLITLLDIKSPNYTIGGTGIITRAGAGTGNYFGSLQFSHQGVTAFNRSGSHDIQQVKQYVNGGATLDVSTGNIQNASSTLASTSTLDFFTINNNGTVKLNTNQIYSNAAQANSGVTVVGRLQTGNVNGLYNNTASAAISNVGNMNFWLQDGSTVEYNGTDNQVITGMGLGNATDPAKHKYYNLDINFAGTPDVEFVYPTNNPNANSVFIINSLNLNAGELNLDNDHDNTSGGRSILIENGSTFAMSSAGGYIRSEVRDGSGAVKWKVGSTTGAHKFYFAYDSNAADTIPFTFNLPAGNADTVSVATYNTNAANVPFPPTVTNCNDSVGVNNSAMTVDRFWSLKSSGTAPSANLTFVYRAAEGVAGNDLRAQRWMVGTSKWEYPVQGAQSQTNIQTVNVNGATGLPLWWRLFTKCVLASVPTITQSGNYLISSSLTGNQWYLDGVLMSGETNDTLLITVSGTYSVMVTDGNNCSATSTDFPATWSFVDEEVLDAGIIISPNPTNGNFVLLFNDAKEKYVVTITNALGEIIYTEVLSPSAGKISARFSLGTFSKGVYLMTLRSAKHQFLRKVVLY